MGTMLALYTTNQGSISGTLKEPSNLAKTVSVSNARSKAWTWRQLLPGFYDTSLFWFSIPEKIHNWLWKFITEDNSYLYSLEY